MDVTTIGAETASCGIRGWDSPEHGSGPSREAIVVSLRPGDGWVERPPHQTWPYLHLVTAVTIDLSALLAVDSRTVSWLLEVRSCARVRVVVLMNRRVHAALRMLGLHALFTFEEVDRPARPGIRT